MKCACPPASAFDAIACCRLDASPVCEAERCLNPREATSAEIVAEFTETVSALGRAQRERAQVSARMAELDGEVIALGVERTRLLSEFSAAVERESSKELVNL